MKKFFLDTDVLLDFSMKREPHFDNSERVLHLISKSFFIGFTSSVVIANLYYLQRKEYIHEDNIRFIKELKDIINILNVTEHTIDKALNSDFKDFEDAIQYFCALENGIDCIITRNKKDFSKSSIPVYTPTEFLNNFIS